MKNSKGILCCVVVAIMIFLLTLKSMVLGSIDVSFSDIFKGLFIEYDRQVAIIYNLRFPRILVSLLAGAGLATSGLLFQSALKNPLADPGIIGISGGALLVATALSALFPMFYFGIPIFACIGGFIAYFLIYSLAWKGSLDPIRIILVGVGVSAVFTGVTSVLDGVSNSSGVSLSVSGLSQLVWSDVNLISIYVIIGLILALILAPVCNILSLDDKTVRSLGINVDLMRMAISAVAVLLCSGVTAVVGIIGFLALISPHISRKIVGNDYKILLPFNMLLGAFILLLADTIGRTIFNPTEISANVIMSILGGPFFILLIRSEVNHGRN